MRPRFFLSGLGLCFASLIVALGTFWAFTRGANDFSVFYEAWRLVLSGRGGEVYYATPDRFLYAPGFAWVFAPLGALPRAWSLAVWCLFKALIIGYTIRQGARALRPSNLEVSSRLDLFYVGIAAWGVVLLARPLLIDFQYGQVNTLILGACVWALARHTREGGDDGSAADWIAWFALAIAAIGKIFPLPLLAIPFFNSSGLSRRRVLLERTGAIAGIAVILAAPLVTHGIPGTIQLFVDWKLALISRGLPLESHNQSFAAFLHHYLSAEPTPIIAQSRRTLDLGIFKLAPQTISLLSVAWTSFFAGLILTWILKPLRAGAWARSAWAAALIGLLILPSHLVWKPYFVMGLPLAILAAGRALQSVTWRMILIALFAAINLTSFDFIGGDLAARVEAACVLLWCHFFWFGAARLRGLATISEKSP